MRGAIHKSFVYLLLLLSVSAQAAVDIQVQGLFKNSAVLTINGKQRLLKVGQESPEGVKLLTANSRLATLLVEGEKVELGLNRRISRTFKKPSKKEVRLAQSYGGHYLTPGRINGRPVKFMVDTGATFVSMDVQRAKALAIPYWRGEKGHTSTANGVIENYRIQLDSVTVGEITLKNVMGAVSLGEMNGVILLGNSFIRKLSWREEKGMLVLEQRFQ